jgi:hypothetical protein
MSKPSPDQSSDTSMFSSEDFLAKTSLKPENVLDSLEIALAFGLSSPVLLAKFDPDGWLLRTLQESFLCEERWEPLSGSWPDSAMWDRTSVYELQTSARPILESGSLLWPTATVQDHKHGTNSPAQMARHKGNLVVESLNWPTARREDGESCGNHPGATDSLTGATRNWTTPTATERSGQGERNKALTLDVKNWLTPHGMHGTDHTGKTGRGGEFAKQATQWPTPQAHDQTGARGKNNFLSDHHHKPHDLVMATDQWQTPATDSFRSRGGDRKDEMGLDQQARSHQAPQTNDGPTSSEKDPTSRRRLNPRFVSWLMGFPPDWTEVEPELPAPKKARKKRLPAP